MQLLPVRNIIGGYEKREKGIINPIDINQRIQGVKKFTNRV
ncbi:hypothetical protein PI172_2200 [Prevotella intermedia]|uniref:Uncharacterized protein n=1 Tax=Prevotella intermedia TaxID=28131 RepID=A0AAD1BKF4_PREIN|nr:hypothetical protein PI172_2200 [Prevotella intermedia]